jgi:hypothetical protein
MVSNVLVTHNPGQDLGGLMSEHADGDFGHVLGVLHNCLTCVQACTALRPLVLLAASYEVSTTRYCPPPAWILDST